MRQIKNKEKLKASPIILAKGNNNQANLNNKKIITFRCDTYLVEKIKNALTSSKLAGNYQHSNFSEVIRQALHKYQQGMKLTYQRKANPKQNLTFYLDEELTNFYQQLPNRSRTEILERALGSYLEKELG